MVAAHRYIKVFCSEFFRPGCVIIKKERFLAVLYDLDALFVDVEALSRELYGVVEDFGGYRWIKVFDFEFNEGTRILVVDVVEPFDDRAGVFPLVDF